MSNNAIAALKRKLDRWELDHLRQHAADLAARLERAEEDRDYYRETTEFWHEESMRMIESLQNDGAIIGISKEGNISVIDAKEAA